MSITTNTKKKIVLQTNAPFIKTGLGENGRYLMKYLLKTGKYDIVYYGTNRVFENDPLLQRMPCKTYGCLPADPAVLDSLNNNPFHAREIMYGSYFIDKIIDQEKPDIWWESDDIWSTNGYANRPWFNKVNVVYHKTIDSLPVMEEAFAQAKTTPNYFVWADFAAKEMNKIDPNLNIKRIYGIFDTEHFAPITQREKAILRARFNLDPKTIIFHTTNRNQLRKGFPQIIQAFASFKKENSHIDAKIHFHTSFSEKQNGWDILKLANYHGVKQSDILCTYVCRECKHWSISNYKGEEIDCPICNKKKTMMTPNSFIGIDDDEMKYMHGLFDAGLSIFNSGGLERFSVSSLLCGLPTAITNYSCGEDFGDLPFVSPIAWEPYYEPGSNFIKATSSISSIKNFMEKVCRTSNKQKDEIAEKSRDWAVKNFSIDVIGKQWEEVFDALPKKDWSSITIENKRKNEDFPNPDIQDDEQWIKSLYNNILNREPDTDGFNNWLNQLKRGVSKEKIYNFFIQVAKEDNAKNEKPKDISSIFDQNGNKKILFVIKDGDIELFNAISLFQDIKKMYPDGDLYVACHPEIAEMLVGNKYVYKVFSLHPSMLNEMAMAPYVDYYYNLEKNLPKFSNNKISLNILNENS